MNPQKEITLVQWCAYLPYGIEIKHNVEFTPKHLTYPNFAMNKNNLAYISDHSERFRPLLRPMNDDNEAAINKMIATVSHSIRYGNFAFYDTNEDFDPIDVYSTYTNFSFEKLPYDVVQNLLSNHYDIFGLIEKGLALAI